MTYHELMTGLLEKGYQPTKCGDHQLDAYCCAKAVYDGYDTFPNPAEAEDLLRDFLELDRREVFKVWYRQGEGEQNFHLTLASSGYNAGSLDACVAYLLNPPL